MIPDGAALLDRRLLFVTGKGGVGKTTVAAALAELAARRGKRVLVCEMDAKGALAAAFDVAPLKFAPTQIAPQLWAMAMNTEDSLREYLRLFVRIPLMGRIGPLARTFDFVADAAPGVKEILAVGKLCYEVRECNYDLVVVDAESSGHIVAQVGAPSAIRDLVHVGLVRDQTNWMIELLHDPAVTGVVVCTTAEEMPVVETLELVHKLRGLQGGAPVAALVANRLLPSRFGAADALLVDRLASKPAASLLERAAGPGAGVVVRAVSDAQHRATLGGSHLQRLFDELPDVPTVLVPELFSRAYGRRVVTLVADALAEEGV